MLLCNKAGNMPTRVYQISVNMDLSTVHTPTCLLVSVEVDLLQGTDLPACWWAQTQSPAVHMSTCFLMSMNSDLLQRTCNLPADEHELRPFQQTCCLPTDEHECRPFTAHTCLPFTVCTFYSAHTYLPAAEHELKTSDSRWSAWTQNSYIKHTYPPVDEHELKTFTLNTPTHLFMSMNSELLQ